MRETFQHGCGYTKDLKHAQKELEPFTHEFMLSFNLFNVTSLSAN
uniref:Uncharacterized protein n=1 Tax=Vibrio splendidus TaxID=29497 RepID=A0A0H3ZWQ8_VIBSP|nr:hypothetical protein [Vibrio splendidus]